MNHTLTFYSVGRYQVDALLSGLSKTGKVEAVDGEAHVSGETPLGEVKSIVNYVEGSGQLSVTITQKPALLSINTIHSHITTALAQAAEEAKQAELVPKDNPAQPVQNVVETTTTTKTATVSTPKPASDAAAKKEENQKASAVGPKS